MNGTMLPAAGYTVSLMNPLSGVEWDCNLYHVHANNDVCCSIKGEPTIWKEKRLLT